MPVTELERVKQDIATIKQAAGLELPFGWDFAWLTLIGFPFVGIWFLVYRLMFEGRSVFILAVPGVLLLAACGYLRFKHRRSTGSSTIKRREYGINFYGSIFILAATLVLFTWARRAGINIRHISGGVIIMCGLMVMVMAFESKQRLPNLGAAIPGILFGISIAVWPTAEAVIRNGCIMLIVAGPAMALIMMYQLKQAGQNNDAD